MIGYIKTLNYAVVIIAVVVVPFLPVVFLAEADCVLATTRHQQNLLKGWTVGWVERVG